MQASPDACRVMWKRATVCSLLWVPRLIGPVDHCVTALQLRPPPLPRPANNEEEDC